MCSCLDGGCRGIAPINFCKRHYVRTLIELIAKHIKEETDEREVSIDVEPFGNINDLRLESLLGKEIEIETEIQGHLTDYGKEYFDELIRETCGFDNIVGHPQTVETLLAMIDAGWIDAAKDRRIKVFTHESMAPNVLIVRRGEKVLGIVKLYTECEENDG